MAEHLRWGILATGSIAHQFAKGLKVSKTGVLQASASRSFDKAAAFAGEYGGKAYGSYEELLADPNVDAVYIATPHHLHSPWVIKAAEAKKAILCEKPFTLNAVEAERTLAEVAKHGVFFMEAFMYRCHPQTQKIKQWIQEGAIGQVLAINSEFSFHAGKDWTNFRADAALGGGGLMDVGSYCVSFSRMVAGEEPTSVSYKAQLSPDGYDEYGAGALDFPSGVKASFLTGIHMSATNDARVYGEKGSIHVEDPWKCYSPSKLTLNRRGQEPDVLVMGGNNDDLYGIEADAVAKYLEAGQCPYMDIQDTINNMKTLDALRASAGIVFSEEVKV